MENKNLETMLGEVTTKANAYVGKYNTHKATKKELKGYLDAATAACKNYNLALSKATYREWMKEGEPVKIAIRSRTIPGAKRLSFKTDDNDCMTLTITDAEYEVDLPQMQATLGAGVFAKPNWFNACEKLMYLVAADLNDRMGDPLGFTYEIDAASKTFEFKDIDPLSSEGIIKAFQIVMDSILYIDDPDKAGTNLFHLNPVTTRHGDIDAKEWRIIRESMTKDNGVNSISLCNTGKFVNYVMRAMHGIMTTGDFVMQPDTAFKMPESEVESAESNKKSAKGNSKKSK